MSCGAEKAQRELSLPDGCLTGGGPEYTQTKSPLDDAAMNWR